MDEEAFQRKLQETADELGLGVKVEVMLDGEFTGEELESLLGDPQRLASVLTTDSTDLLAFFAKDGPGESPATWASLMHATEGAVLTWNEIFLRINTAMPAELAQEWVRKRWEGFDNETDVKLLRDALNMLARRFAVLESTPEDN